MGNEKKIASHVFPSFLENIVNKIYSRIFMHTFSVCKLVKLIGELRRDNALLTCNQHADVNPSIWRRPGKMYLLYIVALYTMREFFLDTATRM